MMYGKSQVFFFFCVKMLFFHLYLLWTTVFSLFNYLNKHKLTFWTLFCSIHLYNLPIWQYNVILIKITIKHVIYRSLVGYSPWDLKIRHDCVTMFNSVPLYKS